MKRTWLISLSQLSHDPCHIIRVSHFHQMTILSLQKRSRLALECLFLPFLTLNPCLIPLLVCFFLWFQHALGPWRCWAAENQKNSPQVKLNLNMFAEPCHRFPTQIYLIIFISHVYIWLLRGRSRQIIIIIIIFFPILYLQIPQAVSTFCLKKKNPFTFFLTVGSTRDKNEIPTLKFLLNRRDIWPSMVF